MLHCPKDILACFIVSSDCLIEAAYELSYSTFILTKNDLLQLHERK